MAEQEGQALVQGQLEAYNAKDLDKFCSYFHDQIVVTDLISAKQACSGMAQFRAIYENFFTSAPNATVQIKSRIIQPTAILDEELVTGAPRYPDGLHIVAIYGFRDSKIDRVWFTR